MRKQGNGGDLLPAHEGRKNVSGRDGGESCVRGGNIWMRGRRWYVIHNPGPEKAGDDGSGADENTED